MSGNPLQYELPRRLLQRLGAEDGNAAIKNSLEMYFLKFTMLRIANPEIGMTENAKKVAMDLLLGFNVLLSMQRSILDL